MQILVWAQYSRSKTKTNSSKLIPTVAFGHFISLIILKVLGHVDSLDKAIPLPPLNI